MPLLRLLCSLATVTLLSAATYAADLGTGREVRLEGDLVGHDQLSGVTTFGDLLIAVPDEGAHLNVLRKEEEGRYTFSHSYGVLKGKRDDEVDMEGITRVGNQLYVLGSHSLARRTLSNDRTYAKNRKRLTEYKEEDTRDNLWRFTIDSQGQITEDKRINLRPILKQDDILGPFTKIPSKENGIDIEGIAYRQGQLFLGFRGPVLRENFATVMVLLMDDPTSYDLRFIQLGGRGIRDLTAVSDGFLVIGGPIGDGEGTYELYWWDGEDQIPGAGAPQGKVLRLGTLSSSAKAEGITVLSETDTTYEVLVVYDGSRRARQFTVPHP